MTSSPCKIPERNETTTPPLKCEQLICDLRDELGVLRRTAKDLVKKFEPFLSPQCPSNEASSPEIEEDSPINLAISDQIMVVVDINEHLRDTINRLK